MNKVAKSLLQLESIWAFGAGLFFPLFAIYANQVGGSIIDAGIAGALFLFATSALEYPIGKLLDKYREKWFIVADYMLEGFVFIGYLFVQDIWQLFVLQIILGLANALGDPAWESMYDRHTGLKKSGSYWANSHMYIGFASALALIIGSFVVDNFGFGPVFVMGGLLSFAAGIGAVIILKKD